MAINAAILDVLVQIRRRSEGACKLVTFGYPDMLVTEPQIDRICGAGTADGIAYRSDSDGILSWHRITGKMQRIAETRGLFDRLGLEADFLDIVASRGVERVLDLNTPAPEDMHGKYDIVYDGGTMEHCFNAPQVIQNALAFCKLGGHIVHVNPLNYYNHGFYSFHPTFYYDFYSQSGNRLAAPIYGLYGPVLETKVMELPPVAGVAELPPRLAIMVVAQKTSDAAFKWPMQSKYLKNPTLGGVASGAGGAT